MTASIPAKILPPMRGKMLRAESATHAGATSTRDLSLTVTIEESARTGGRRFAFRAMRSAETAVGAMPEPESQHHHAGMIADGGDPHGAALNGYNVRSSTTFLAGAIAQARPATVLHNPPYREAAGAYRRGDQLGDRETAPGLRSDKRV